MSEQKFLPRIVVLRKTIGESHDPVDAIVLDPDGMLRPIEDVVYLSVQEHEHILNTRIYAGQNWAKKKMAEKDKRIERLREALKRFIDSGLVIQHGASCYTNEYPFGNCTCNLSGILTTMRIALQED